MTSKIFLLLLSALIAFAAVGCSADSATVTPEQKKAFVGSAPPADFMKNHVGAAAGGPQSGGAGAQAAADKAMAAAKAQHGG